MSSKPRFRAPVSEDGASVHNLIAHCPPLDGNSLYCNLLQCTHFANTSVAAELDGELCGFVSGYLIPERSDILFIWQVAVSRQARGLGLATQMIRQILLRNRNEQINYLETSITPENAASWALFQGLARDLDADCEESVLFDRERHFNGLHDSEMLLRIGPISIQASKS